MMFLVERLNDEHNVISTLSIPIRDKIRLTQLVEANQLMIGEYMLAAQQSYGERTSLWGREARHGLFTACRIVLKRYRHHPDFNEEWM